MGTPLVSVASILPATRREVYKNIILWSMTWRLATQLVGVIWNEFPMPKSGGQSGKLGDLYEALWTVELALDVFEGRLRSITVEAFGEESGGVEFHVLTNLGTLQFHSVKRQKVGGDWSIVDLCYVENKSTKRSILGDLFSKLVKWADAEIYFVSGTGANALRNLEEQSKAHSSASEFCATLSKNSRADFQKLAEKLCCGDSEAVLRALKALHVRLRDHGSLKETIERRIASLFYRINDSELRADDVRRSLYEYLVENLGQTFATDSIREFMAIQGLGLRDWKIDTTVRDAVAKANERYRSIAEKELINGSQIIREEVPEIVASIIDSESRGALIVAPGGYGKSCVLAQCLRQFPAHNIQYLCLRMDSFDPCRTTRQLGAQMDLRESPVSVLAGVADNAPSVLVVDQLDAMSLVSGRNPQMWEVFEELKRETQTHPHMKLLLACRDFDLHHDQRLRSLGADTSGITKHPLSMLTVDEVRISLATANVGQHQLPDASVEILRVPFHLLLFLQGEPSRTFATAGELFDRYWERKRQKLRERLSREPHWNEVIDALTVRMSERQLLFAPISAVGNWSEDASTMASENVLVEVTEHRQYRFFHESFFDYAYARRFCESKGGDVIQLLTSSEQHLFRRAQVRQILAYRRENDFPQYLDDVAAIISSSKVRFHIKHMVASEFRRLAKPTADEWRILEPHLLDGELSRYVSPALRDHTGWFDLMNSLGVFAKWLASHDGRLVNAAIWYLESHDLHKSRSAEIARLIAPYADRDGEWRHRMLRIMSWGQSHQSPEMTAIYLRLIERGAYDEYESGVIGSDFWSQHHSAEKDSPHFLIDVVATWFDHAVTTFDDGSRNFFDKCPNNNSHTGALMVYKAAADAPEYFVERMLHRVKAVVLKTAFENFGEVFDRAWPSLTNNGDPFKIDDAILLALRRALQHLAKHHPATLRKHTQKIASAPHRTFGYLLLRAWTDNPDEFANECAEYLIADRRRLNIGYSSWSHDGEGNGESAISRRALAAISPHCSAKLHATLECAIIGYCDEHEKATPRWRGSSELLRLLSLAAARISKTTALRIEELERKFPHLPNAIVSEDDATGARCIGSPIDQSVGEKMTDEQWISAMRKYDGTTDRFRGGPVELSRMVGDFARKDRKRFAALVDQMPDEVDSMYFSAILDGMCSRGMNLSQQEKAADESQLAVLPTEMFLRVITRLHDLPNRPCGSAIVGCIQILAERSLPASCLDIVSHYAMNDRDPEADIWKPAESRLNYSDGDPHSHGINCVRGQAAECLGSLLFADESRLEALKPALVATAEDPVISVRTCAIHAFLPLINFSRDFAVELFLKACGRCPEICATHPFNYFVHYAIRTHYAEIRGLLQFALSTDEANAVGNAARQISLAELCDVDVGDDVRSVRSGSEVMRTAAAEVYATHIGHDEIGRRCAEALREFLNDQSEDVRLEVSRAFFKLSGLKLLQFQGFIAEYIESQAFENEPDCLLRALDQSNVELPQVICRAAERILEFVGEEGTHIAYHSAMTAHHISTLVVRQYEQATDSDLKTRCLDLIDRMERVGYYGIAEELGRLDR